MFESSCSTFIPSARIEPILVVVIDVVSVVVAVVVVSVAVVVVVKLLYRGLEVIRYWCSSKTN